MEKTIQYTDMTFHEVKNDIMEMSKTYYSDIFRGFSDASVGSWLIDMVSDVYDNSMYALNRTYQETTIDSANTRAALLTLARNAGVRVPGNKCAIVEVELSCDLPLNTSNNVSAANNIAIADEDYAPIIRRGTLFSTGNVTFELQYDVDFSNPFDANGISDRKEVALYNSNGTIVAYRYQKLGIAVASQSKVFKKIISSNDIEPFMTIQLQDENIVSVDSIILKQGSSLVGDPDISEFFVDRESYEGRDGKPVLRYFEVENLADQFRFGYEENDVVDTGNGVTYYNPVWDVIDAIEVGTDVYEPIRLAMRGKWKRLKNKFITEYTDNGYLNITFGAGIRNQYGDIPQNASLFAQWLMSHMEANDYMGSLPEPNTTMYILYRTGGGEIANIAENTLTNILYINIDIDGNCNNSDDATRKNNVRGSLRVTNPSVSYGGKDAPSDEELKMLIRYASAAQNRCVTLHDYQARLMQIHPKYGVPFRTSVVEENNKVCIYSLGLNYNGTLTSLLSETVADNMKEYLSKYRMINDFIEIRSGKVINIAFDCDVYIDKTYNTSTVSKNIINLIRDYMDVRRHKMGEDIFLGDLEKEISKLDGVLNLIRLRVYNMVGNGYSDTAVTQELVNRESCGYDADYSELGGNEINLLASDKTLISNSDSMFEILNPGSDIRINVKTK